METLTHKTGREFRQLRVSEETWRLVRREAFERELTIGKFIEELARAAETKRLKRSA